MGFASFGADRRQLDTEALNQTRVRHELAKLARQVSSQEDTSEAAAADEG